MKFKNTFFAFVAVFLFAGLQPVHAEETPKVLVGELFFNGSVYATTTEGITNQSAAPRSQEPSLLEIRLRVDQGEESFYLRDLEPMHMKMMHLVLVSEDFESFAHMHPVWDRSTGSFALPLNMATVNPDNQSALRALQKGGRFFVYAEVKSKSLGMKKFAWDVEAEGPRADRTLKEDPRDSQGRVVKYFNDVGETASVGATYRAEFKRSQSIACGGALIQADIKISKIDEEGVYQLATDVKPWMMMGSHALVLGHGARNAAEKNFAHIHGGVSPEGALYRLSFFDRGNWGDELVQFWLQSKIDGKVRTFDFTFYHEKIDPRLIDCAE